MEVVEYGPLTDAQRAALEGGEEHPFGTEGIELYWRPKERHVMLRDDAGRLLASTGLLVVEVSAGEAEPFEVVGLGGVIVAPGHRGEGLARVVVEAALERAATIGPDLAMLFCRDGVAGLYRKLGFELRRAADSRASAHRTRADAGEHDVAAACRRRCVAARRRAAASEPF